MKNLVTSALITCLMLTPQIGYPDSITDTFNDGDTITSDSLNNIISAVNDNDARIVALEAAPKTITATTPPTVNDDINDGYPVGSAWINTTDETAYILVDSAPGAAVWKLITAQSNEDGKAQVTGTILSLGDDNMIIAPDADTVCGISSNQLFVTLDDNLDLLTVIITENSSVITPGGSLEVGQAVGMTGSCEGSEYMTDNAVIIDDQR